MCFSGLSTTTQNHIISIIDSCLKADTESKFKCNILSQTEDLFGQGMTAYGLADLQLLKVTSFSNLGFPPPFLEQIIDRSGAIKSPLFYRWIGSRSPQKIHKEQKRNNTQSSKQLAPYIEFELGNVLSYGLIDITQRYGTYFAFAQMAESIKEHHTNIIEILMPHLHIAYSRLINLPQSSFPHHLSSDKTEKTTANEVTLTAREKDIIRWLFDGKSNWEIGAILNISEYTVKNYVQRLMAKFSAKNRTHLVAKALGMSLIQLGG